MRTAVAHESVSVELARAFPPGGDIDEAYRYPGPPALAVPLAKDSIAKDR